MGQSRGLWGGYASKVCEVQVFLEGLEFVCVCVCVCVPGNGWFLQDSNFRIVLAVQGNNGAGSGRAGQGTGRGRAQALP